MKKRIWIPALLLAAGALLAGMCSGRESRTTRVLVNGHEFHIPGRNNSWFFPVFPFSMPEPDNAFLLRFYAADIRQAIPAYVDRDGDYTADLHVRLKGFSPERTEKFCSPGYLRYSRPWYGTGSYAERVVGIHEPTGYYKVHDRRWPESSWKLMTLRPEAGRPLPERLDDFWVTSCSDVLATAAASGTLTSCFVDGFYEDNIFFSFQVTIENLPFREELRDYVRRQLRAFESPHTRTDPPSVSFPCFNNGQADGSR